MHLLPYKPHYLSMTRYLVTLGHECVHSCIDLDEEREALRTHEREVTWNTISGLPRPPTPRSVIPFTVLTATIAGPPFEVWEVESCLSLADIRSRSEDLNLIAEFRSSGFPLLRRNDN